MNYRKFTSILAICSISLSVFGCSVKEAQTETSETSEAVITEESELPTVSVTETETVIENETADFNANCKFSVFYFDGKLKSITQYDENGNREIEWFRIQEGDYFIRLFDTADPDSNFCKRFKTDYYFEKFENKDIHFLLDGIDIDSGKLERYINQSKNYISYEETEDAKGNIVSIIGVIQKNNGGYRTEITKNIYDINDLLNRKTIITYGTSDDTEVKEYLYH